MGDFQNAREVLEQFDFSAALDVILIAAAIFSVFRLLSRTRAITLLRGVVALVLLAVIFGRVFDLTVVNFVAENGLVALIVAAAVVFQPEIRSGLDRLGRTGIQDLLVHIPAEGAIEAVAESATRMARAHHGALVVFERETGLQDVIDTGVPVDARVSPELITGIFFPNSPLHDMAMVIREDRVVAASCELPLAGEFLYSARGFGTRHRAAIGITEQTDAVSVVVSQETGEISLAQGGQLVQVEYGSALVEELKQRLLKWSNGAGDDAATGARRA